MNGVILSATRHEKLNTPIPQVITGVGTRNTLIHLSSYLHSIPTVDTIINIGYVGAVDVPVGTVVQVGKVAYRDYDTSIYEEEFEASLSVIPDTAFPVCTCYTGDSFYVGNPTRTSLSPETIERFPTGTVFDMELAAIAQYLKDTNTRINLYSIKVVSDNGSTSQYSTSVETLRRILDEAALFTVNKILYKQR